ncbi:MAG: hypothetical protein ACREPM_06205 [Gemmatimonadaceae bacterium]
MRRVVLVPAIALAIALAIAGCRERANVGNGPYADKVAEDVPKIEKALGVKFKTPPKLEIRDRAQVRELVLSKLNEPAALKEAAAQEAVYKLLGMIPDTMHLADALVKVLSEQIMGYYDPKTKVLYVVKDAPDEYVGLTIMHELVHALQDQYVNLDSLESITGDDDRATAAQAVVEGEATYESTYIIAGGSGNLAVQLPGGWESLRATIREGLATQPVFSSSPMVIQESLLFPYINGADFVRRFKAHEPGKLPFEKLPVSTEQLMHDSAYFGKTPDIPSDITLPKIANTTYENDFGEFGTRLFLYQHTHDQDRSIRASNGWDGDRYALVKTPSGDALVWATVWDSPGDAAEFMSAVDAVMQHRFIVRPRVTGDKRHFDAGKRTVDVDVREVNGRPLVLYVDTPSGAGPLVDIAQIKVTPR